MPKHHLFVCTNKRPAGHPKGSCADRGCNELLMALSEEIERQELYETVKVNTTNCLGPCQQGPTMVVYPEGVWYVGIKQGDVAEIVVSHLVNDVPVERLMLREA